MGEVESLKPGELISRTAPGETGISYHVYAPNNYKTTAQAPPILIAFSPGGNGQGMVDKLKDGFEEAGWILVGCDQLRNGLDDRELAVKMEDEVLDAIFATIPHDPKRVYLGGFSGGAMRAYSVTTRRPEPIAGIFAYGGWLGGSDYQDHPYRRGMSVAMINGNRDRGANAWVATDTATLRERDCTVKHYTFLGGHKTAPPNITRQVVEWMEEEWLLKSGDRSASSLSPLKILYLGEQNERAKDFAAFLSKRFQSVSHVEAGYLTIELLNEADVLLVDQVLRDLPEAHTKAMMLTAPAAKLTAEYYGSKLAWLEKSEPADDMEEVSGGIREAHRLLWMDKRSPSEMNEQEREQWAQALEWIHSFDGHQQSIFQGIRSRSEMIQMLEDSRTNRETLIRWFPKGLLEQHGYNKQKLREYFRGKLGFVHVPFGSGLLRIDEEAERFGVPNNDPKSIPVWIEALKTDQKKQAQSLLLRYTHQRIRGRPELWTEWYETHNDSLMFSDEKGYRFYVGGLGK